MSCPRCHGLMVKDRFFDLLDSVLHIDAWRCISCGEVLDGTIRRNRVKRGAR